jgi:type 1 glutamine amidotransferase
MSKKLLFSLFVLLASLSMSTLLATEPLKKLVIMAGRPSHPPRMHEFNAGVQLLHKCLAGSAVEPHFVLNGWPEDEAIFNDAAAVVFYMDGGKGHEVVKQEGRRLKMIEQWAQKGVGLGFMHFGVEVVPDQAGAEFKRWIGGHYEHEHSCNPIWEASFESFPNHPIASGVKPFKIKDEWYFNIRFAGDIAGNQPTEVSGLKFVPILVTKPTDETRDGPYVYPKGPYKHIQANKGRAETMMWTVERADGGRGMGFTGGHFHDNWANEDFRKVILNSFYWLAKVDVPKDGVVSLAATDINANLDPKGK